MQYKLHCVLQIPVRTAGGYKHNQAEYDKHPHPPRPRNPHDFECRFLRIFSAVSKDSGDMNIKPHGQIDRPAACFQKKRKITLAQFEEGKNRHRHKEYTQYHRNPDQYNIKRQRRNRCNGIRYRFDYKADPST